MKVTEREGRKLTQEVTAGIECRDKVIIDERNGGKGEHIKHI